MRWIARAGVVDDSAERLSSFEASPTDGAMAAAMRLVVTVEDRPAYMTAGAEPWSRFLLPGLIALGLIGATIGMMMAPTLL